MAKNRRSTRQTKISDIDGRPFTNVRKEKYEKPPHYTPTPEQIAEATAEIRKEWDEVTLNQRAGVYGRKPYELKTGSVGKEY